MAVWEAHVSGGVRIPEVEPETGAPVHVIYQGRSQETGCQGESGGGPGRGEGGISLR